MRKLVWAFTVMTVLGCKKKDSPLPPSGAQLVFPERNSECTTGQNLGATTSQVEFRWSAADNTETYELRVTNINTNVTQTVSTRNLSAKLPIEKGAFFSWLVNTRNSRSDRTVSSETWRFYNAGFLTSHPPFPPEINSPKLAETVFKDVNNEVTLDWSGADIDDDIVGYDLYFSTETPPEALIASPGAGVTTRKVSVAPNTVYYWRVVAKDSNGHTADSGIFEFKVF